MKNVFVCVCVCVCVCVVCTRAHMRACWGGRGKGGNVSKDRLSNKQKLT